MNVADGWVMQQLARSPGRSASVYAGLSQLAGRMDHAGRVEMTHRQLGARITRCQRQAQNIIRKLVAAGLVLVEHRAGRGSLYRVLAPWIRPQLDGEANTRTPGTVGTDTPGRGRESTAAQPRGDGASDRRRPPLFSALTKRGGCFHSDVACDECRKHG